MASDTACTTTSNSHEKTLPSFNQPSQQRRPNDKMRTSRKMFLGLLCFVLVGYGVSSAVFPDQDAPHEQNIVDSKPSLPDSRGSSWSRLLNSASRDSLHEILHSYLPGTYKHGIYASDQEALEAVHANDATLATSLAQLAKRQDVGANATTSTSIVQTPTLTSSQAPTIQETTTAPTTSPTSPPPPATTPTTTSPTTVVAPSTPATSSQSPSPSTTQTSSVIVISTSSRISIPSSTIPGQTTLSSATIPGGSTRVTSGASSITRPPPTPVTSTFVSTLGNGVVTTITSVRLIDPPSGETVSTTEPAGTLQTGVAALHRRDVTLEVLVGAVVGGVLLA